MSIFLDVFVQDDRDLLGRDLGVDVGVNRHDGCQAACAEAAGPFEREHAIGGRLAERDPELFGQTLSDLVSAFDVTGGPEAKTDDVFAGRIEAEEVVEAGDARYFGRRDTEQLPDRIEMLDVEVTVFGLHPM